MRRRVNFKEDVPMKTLRRSGMEVMDAAMSCKCLSRDDVLSNVISIQIQVSFPYLSGSN